MIKMIMPNSIMHNYDSGFDSGSSPEFFGQHPGSNDEAPKSRTEQYRKVNLTYPNLT